MRVVGLVGQIARRIRWWVGELAGGELGVRARDFGWDLCEASLAVGLVRVVGLVGHIAMVGCW